MIEAKTRIYAGTLCVTSHKEQRLFLSSETCCRKLFSHIITLDHQNMYATFLRCSSLAPSSSLLEPLTVCSRQNDCRNASIEICNSWNKSTHACVHHTGLPQPLGDVPWWCHVYAVQVYQWRPSHPTSPLGIGHLLVDNTRSTVVLWHTQRNPNLS